MNTRNLEHTALILLGALACTALAHPMAHAQDGGEAEPQATSQDSRVTLDAETEIGAPDEPGTSGSSADDGSTRSPLESRFNAGLVLGGKVGGGLGKPWSDFGATPVFELEIGYALPPLHRAIEVFVTGQYTQPGLSGTSSVRDPRLPGSGLVSYDLVQQELTLSLGALYRIDVGSSLVMPYAGLGGRMYLLNTKVKGSAAGQAYGQNEETQMRGGLLLLGGAELMVGPGALLGELSFGWASVDSFVLRNTNLGALNLAVGYRLML